MKVTIQDSHGYLPLDFVATATGGELILLGMESIPCVKCLCTDSREADKDTLFCAIRGERVDGHAYINAAHTLGCVAFLCEKIPQDIKTPCALVVVKDTVEALSKLAKAYRETYLQDLTFVAVTGSVGKTTTKECVGAVLSEGSRLFKKEGNYNSTIGLPLSVLEIDSAYQSAVLEMGMSGFGEISAMTYAVAPHIAMVTNIGHAHMELLGSRENIAKAKLEIVESMGQGDILLVNGDEPLLLDACPPIEERGIRVLPLSMTDPKAHVYISNIQATPRGMSFDLTMNGKTYENLTISAVGIHMVWAAAFATVTGLCLGMEQHTIQAGLDTYTPAAMRQNVYEVGEVTVIEDCYNASPESMKAAFSVLTLTAKKRMIAVLGDMKELGEGSVELHREVGRALVSATEGREVYLVTIGELGREIAHGARLSGLAENCIYTAPCEMPYTEVAQHLKTLCQPQDTLLFKASRAMKLEAIIEQMKNC